MHLLEPNTAPRPSTAARTVVPAVTQIQKEDSRSNQHAQRRQGMQVRENLEWAAAAAVWQQQAARNPPFT
jgi:hypothetical protein